MVIYLAKLTKRVRLHLISHPDQITTVKLAIVFCLFWIICWGRLDLDFGWHLQAGNYIRQHGVPSHDIFTYTANTFRWADHEWGNDVFVSFIYQHFGFVGLTTIYAAIWTA